jgi:hypothetical protein
LRVTVAYGDPGVMIFSGFCYTSVPIPVWLVPKLGLFGPAVSARAVEMGEIDIRMIMIDITIML